MNIQRMTVVALVALSVSTAFAQDGVRASSSLYLPAYQKPDVTVPYGIADEGIRYEPTWGLDQAWIDEGNLMKGLNHIGKENIGIGRSAFRFTHALVNDSALASDVITKMRERNTLFNKISTTLPIVFTADQGAGADVYFVKNKVANIEHWAAMINSHVHWMQKNTKHPVVGISPFNEGDYWSVEEGASPAKQWQVAKLLKENYPRCADIAMVGGNTLNDDKALEWYTSGKQYYDWGNTHQLAGSFDNFAKFFTQLQKDGKVGYADEMHNVGEAMVGLEYGMTVGIWWGFDSRARGEFCQISRHGSRLAYGEHRNNWTAASVWRHDDGRVKAFVGSSERQAYTTNYQFVSRDRDVYYDGYGPMREFLMEMPGGTGYQQGQTNAERVIDVTWGEDVQPKPITPGVYKFVNMATGNVATAVGDNILQQIYSGSQNQQWNVAPVSSRIGGDYSFYEFTSVGNAKLRMNLVDFSTSDGANIMAYSQNDNPDVNEQWYLEYVGNGYFHIRNRTSAYYLTSSAASSVNGINVVQRKLLTSESSHKQQLWRILPVDVEYETVAPAQPSGLEAKAQPASVMLTWTASADDDVEGYMVLRAPEGTDEWNTIARMLTTTSFTDNTCRPGTSYIYKVKAVDRAQNLSEASETVSATPTGTQSLIAHWQMEDNLNDATANMMDAVHSRNATFVENCKQGQKALKLTGSQFVQLPYEVGSSDELTVMMWVNLHSNSAWQRLFDFGYDTDHYLFLSPTNGSVMRFGIKNGGVEQTVSCKSELPTSQWKHVAVTIGSDKTVIYVDGEEATSSTAISIRPSDVRPVLNYIGRSQFTADPFLNAELDDVRIYNYALSADDVKTVMDGNELEEPDNPDDPDDPDDPENPDNPVVTPMPGDVNGDGKVDIVDVTTVISHILGQSPTDFNPEAADVNNDNVVDIVDVTTIIDMILKGNP